jgi:YegS/Rv2252/BmrU family lipid kinase
MDRQPSARLELAPTRPDAPHSLAHDWPDRLPGSSPGAGYDRRAQKLRLEQEIRSEHRAVLLVNRRSRRGERFYTKAKLLLEKRGITLDPEFSSPDTPDLSRLISDAIDQGHRFIIVGGGDGTLSPLLAQLVYRNVVLGILPLGTANSFARSLGIPVDLESAVDVLVAGQVVDVDLGRIGDHYFSTVASVGLAAKIARHMPARLKKWLGRLAYPLVALVQLRHYGAFRCTIRSNTDYKTLDALEVRVANAAYQGGVAVTREASAESRDLVVQVTTGRSVRKLLRVWLRLTAGVRPEPTDLQTFRGTNFFIDAVPKQYVSVDGDAFTETPFEANIAQQALFVMVPRDRRDLE